MMNFLDLSAASEEERRLIREILSDTSIVNIATHYPIPSPQPADGGPQQNADNQHGNTMPSSNVYNNNNHAPNLQHNRVPSVMQTAKHYQHHQQHHQHQSNHQQQHIDHNQQKNNVNNMKNPIYHQTPSYSSSNSTQQQQHQQHPHHQQPHQLDNPLKNNVNNIIKNHMYHHSPTYTSPNLSQQQQQHQQHHQQHQHQQQQHHHHQQHQQIHHQHQQHMDGHPKNSVNNNLKNQIYHHTTPSYNTQNLTSSHQQQHQPTQQRQTTNTSRPQAVPQPSAQLPPLAGDINRVIGMDMGPTRPPGYAMTPYGPPPPTSHVYGAPPLFQYPPHHYLIHYNIPQYIPPYMMQPPTNTMVPPRLVPPQTNQSPASPDSTSSTSINNSRPHHVASTTPASVATSATITSVTRNLEPSSVEIGNNHSQQYEQDNQLSNPIQLSSLEIKVDNSQEPATEPKDIDALMKDIDTRLSQTHLPANETPTINNDDSAENQAVLVGVTSKTIDKQDVAGPSSSTTTSTNNIKSKPTNSAINVSNNINNNILDHNERGQVKSDNGSKSNNKLEFIELSGKSKESDSTVGLNSEDVPQQNADMSSDGTLDSQTRPDQSKQQQQRSQENTIDTSDNNNATMKSSSSSPSNSETTTNKFAPERTKQDSTKPIEDEHAQKSQGAGPWGSASSKSWADLFKKRGRLANESSSDNEQEQNYNSDDNNNSDDDQNIKHSATKQGKGSTKSGSTLTATQKELRSQERSRRALDKLGPRLATKVNTITLKHSLPFLKPRGFINKGNGCYINATLQALIACPPFYNLMKEIGDLRINRRENSCTPIIDSFAELFLNFPPLDMNKKNKQQASSVGSTTTPATSNSTDQKMSINNLQAESIEPKCIYSVLGQIKSECLKGAQEDAEEFLSCVLNGLHEEMIGLSEFQNNNNNDSNSTSDREDRDETIDHDPNPSDNNLWREVGAKNRSLPIRQAKIIKTPIQDIFGGSLFSIRTAGKDRCGHLSPFFDLQLDISSDNVKSVQDAIKSFTAPEIINDFYCSKTKQKLDAQRRTFLSQLPPILILHLKQFVYSQDHGLRKLMKKIEYPIDFEIPENCVHEKSSASDRNLRMSRSYKLLAVVYHDGKEAIKGHYLTDVYHIGSSQWIRCDDSSLKVVHSPRIENSDSSRTPYLLFYRRLNTLRAQTGNHDNNNSTKKKNG